MSEAEQLDLMILLPNGELNAPFLLANANLLLKAGEFKTAGSLFLRIAKTKKYAYCGYYGLGLCFRKLGQTEQAVEALKKSYLLEKRAYIAIELVKTLLESGRIKEAEQLSFACAAEFSDQAPVVEEMGKLFQQAIEQR